MIESSEWDRACLLARRRGLIRPTLANLVAAYRCINQRFPFEELARMSLE